jgi:ATP-dependent exoDNAse (exonuclease V) beta subunit
MPEFKHEFLEKYNIEQINTGTARYYVHDGIKALSVTNFLGLISDNTWLEEWKARVGEDKAKQISDIAKTRGTAVHDLCEQYLLNNDKYALKAMPFNLLSFNSLKPFLDEHVNKIYGLEHRLFSKKLKLSGTADCICEWDGTLSILDFKTSKSIKTIEDIPNYFLQAVIYAAMLHEMYGLVAKKLVIAMMVDHEPKAQIFVEDTGPWLRKFKLLFSQHKFAIDTALKDDIMVL